jgi:hypothetical protein
MDADFQAIFLQALLHKQNYNVSFNMIRRKMNKSVLPLDFNSLPYGRIATSVTE